MENNWFQFLSRILLKPVMTFPLSIAFSRLISFFSIFSLQITFIQPSYLPFLSLWSTAIFHIFIKTQFLKVRVTLFSCLLILEYLQLILAYDTARMTWIVALFFYSGVNFLISAQLVIPCRCQTIAYRLIFYLLFVHLITSA